MNWMYELIFVDFVNFNKSWKNQSWQNVGDLSIVKNKSRWNLRKKSFNLIYFTQNFIEIASWQ